MRICYYVSDHGWGHAARSVAIIRELLATREDVEVIVKADYALGFMQNSLKSERVEFDRCNNDFGFVLAEGSLEVDKEKTEELLTEWLSDWDAFIEKEGRFCREHDVALIISDVAPQPFLVAKDLDVPSVAISNFTWYEVYQYLFGNIPEVERIHEAYRQASHGLVLPMSTNGLPFHEQKSVGLVVRLVTRERGRIRHDLGLKGPETLIFFGAGRSIDMDAMVIQRLAKSMPPFTQLLVPSGCPAVGANVSVLPSNETETQDYLAACDVIVTKAGYSTVAEAIQGNVPMLVARRDGIIEDQPILNTIKHLGVGREIAAECFATGGWLEEALGIAGDESVRAAYGDLPWWAKENGCASIVREIKRILNE